MTSFDHDRMKNKLLKDYDHPVKTEKNELDTEKLYKELDDYFSDSNSVVPSLSFLRKNKIYVIICIIALSIFSSLGVYAYRFSLEYQKNAEIILVEAPITPYKVKPEEPGGMVIPNTDKSVYNVISHNESENEKIKLVDNKAEKVIIKNDHKDLISDIIDNLENLELKEKESVEAQNNVEQNTRELVKVTLPVDPEADHFLDNDKNNNIKKTVITQIDESKISVKNVKNNSAKQGNYLIQLGAFKTKDDAQKNWQKIHNKYNYLSDLDMVLEKADLGKKGIFYRLKAGYFADESKARKICNKLIDNKLGCFIVRKK